MCEHMGMRLVRPPGLSLDGSTSPLSSAWKGGGGAGRGGCVARGAQRAGAAGQRHPRGTAHARNTQPVRQGGRRGVAESNQAAR